MVPHRDGRYGAERGDAVLEPALLLKKDPLLQAVMGQDDLSLFLRCHAIACGPNHNAKLKSVPMLLFSQENEGVVFLATDSKTESNQVRHNVISSFLADYSGM